MSALNGVIARAVTLLKQINEHRTMAFVEDESSYLRLFDVASMGTDQSAALRSLGIYIAAQHIEPVRLYISTRGREYPGKQGERFWRGKEVLLVASCGWRTKEILMYPLEVIRDENDKVHEVVASVSQQQYQLEQPVFDWVHAGYSYARQRQNAWLN